MHRFIILTVIVAAVIAFLYSDRLGENTEPVDADKAVDQREAATPATGAEHPGRAVLDITVHTVGELRVLFDRAEKLAETAGSGSQDASVVLVLHGPEVEFFSTRNYARYKDIVDQAARLDAHDVVDVKICQTMMAMHGISRDDIPPFIEQVPDGTVEIENLVREGYVYF